VTGIKLRTGTAGRAQVSVKAHGANLLLPAPASGEQFFAQDSTVTAQVLNGAGVCWDADYTSPANKNAAANFLDKND
jgi:hypothetical protein